MTPRVKQQVVSLIISDHQSIRSQCQPPEIFSCSDLSQPSLVNDRHSQVSRRVSLATKLTAHDNHPSRDGSMGASAESMVYDAVKQRCCDSQLAGTRVTDNDLWTPIASTTEAFEWFSVRATTSPLPPAGHLPIERRVVDGDGSCRRSSRR